MKYSIFIIHKIDSYMIGNCIIFFFGFCILKGLKYSSDYVEKIKKRIFIKKNIDNIFFLVNLNQ